MRKFSILYICALVLCIIFFYSLLIIFEDNEEEEEFVNTIGKQKEIMNFTELRSHKPKNNFSFMFYSTNIRYLCNCFILVSTIQENIENKSNIYNFDYNILVPNSMVQTSYIMKANKLKIKLINVEKKLYSNNQQSHWADSLTKFYVFAQTQYERIVYLDCDSLVKKDITHLFHLPKHFLYAPIGKKIGNSI